MCLNLCVIRIIHVIKTEFTAHLRPLIFSFFSLLTGINKYRMKKRIALVTGGYSGEAEISYKSVITVGNNVDTNKYDVYKIDIQPQGWWYEDEKRNKRVVDKSDFTIRIAGEKIG